MGLSNPDIRIAAVGALGTALIDYHKQLGRVHIRKVGTGDVYVKFNGIPAAAPADGQFTLDDSIPFYDADDIEFSSIGFYSVAGNRVECLAYISNQGVVIR